MPDAAKPFGTFMSVATRFARGATFVCGLDGVVWVHVWVHLR
jgi:hypothetical protein